MLGVNAITRGGALYNGITEIVGPPSSFKTTMALGLVKQAQLEHGKDSLILWMTREGMLDVTWARHVGVRVPYSKRDLLDLQKAGLDKKTIDAMTAEQASCGNLVVLAGSSVEKDMDAAIRFLESGLVDLFILDSVGAIAAAAEIEGSFEDTQVAVNPRLVGKFTRRILNICNLLAEQDHETAFVLLNQVRAIIGGPPTRGNRTEKPGGYGLKHNKHLCIETAIVGFARDKKNQVWAKEVAFKVDKSKVCVPHRSCVVTYVVRGDNPLNLPIGPNVYAEAAHMAADCGIFEYRSGKWWYHDSVIEVADPETGTVSEARKDTLMYFLYQNPQFLNEVQTEILHFHRNLEVTGSRSVVDLSADPESQDSLDVEPEADASSQ